MKSEVFRHWFQRSVSDYLVFRYLGLVFKYGFQFWNFFFRSGTISMDQPALQCSGRVQTILFGCKSTRFNRSRFGKILFRCNTGWFDCFDNSIINLRRIVFFAISSNKCWMWFGIPFFKSRLNFNFLVIELIICLAVFQYWCFD